MTFEELEKRWEKLNFKIVAKSTEILEIKHKTEKIGFEFYKTLNIYLIVNDEDYYLLFNKKIHNLISKTLNFWNKI